MVALEHQIQLQEHQYHMQEEDQAVIPELVELLVQQLAVAELEAKLILPLQLTAMQEQLILAGVVVAEVGQLQQVVQAVLV
jgi:hypothetical protein